MGTVVVLDLYGDESVTSDALAPFLRGALHELHEADRVFSTYDPTSVISRIRAGALEPCDAGPVVAEVLARCRVARDASQGWFDPWAMPGGLDPTGLVKGWAAQRALEHLRSAPLCGAIVNAAGDLASFGGPRPGARFRVGVTDPHDPTSLVALVDLAGALATSGTYERGAHLVDPFSATPTARLASASVSGPDLGLADALATALCVAGVDLLDAIAALAGYEAFTVAHDGRRQWTRGFALAGVARAEPAS